MRGPAGRACTVVQMDNYFRDLLAEGRIDAPLSDPERFQEARRRFVSAWDFDCPEAFDLARLRGDLEALRRAGDGYYYY